MEGPTWDPEKARSNLAKHQVTFEEACEVLRHPLTRRWADLGHSDDEDRVIAIGVTERSRLLMVVTALEQDGTIRIISARRAMKRERHAYEEL